MFKGNIINKKIKVFKGRKTSTNNFLYELEKNDFLIKKIKNIFFGIQPSFTIIKENKQLSQEKKSETKSLLVYKIRVRCDITRMILNENTSMYEREKYLRNVNSSKTYTFSHDLLNYVSKLQAFIEKEIKENNFNEENLTYVIDFNKIEQYNVIEHPTKYSSEQIHNFLNVIEKNDDIHVGNLILLIKTLTNFKNDLLEVLEKTEPEITKVFKKYKTMLSIVLLGINFIPTYGKSITTAHYKPVIPDISLFNENNDSIYLIELKKATDLMFNDTFYRNNTLKIKPDFFNAIHQTNVQRNMLAVAAEHYYETIPK